MKSIFKIGRIITLTILMLSMVTGCSNDTRVQGVTLDKSEIKVFTGGSDKLSLKIEPPDLKEVTVTWSSSNDKVALVSNDGVVSGISPGSAMLTVTTNNGKTASCKVIVINEIVAASINLNLLEKMMVVNEESTLIPTILPEDTDNKEIKWESSDTDIVTVSNGKIVATAEGKAMISATTVNGLKASCQIEVLPFTQEILNAYLEDQPLFVSSSKYFVQSSEWKALYPDMLQVIITNTSKDDIKDVVVGFMAWDSNNLPIKIKASMDFSDGAYLKLVDYDGINLIPGASFGDSSGFEIEEGLGIKTFRAAVKSYTTFEGKTWINPHFSKWQQMYEGKKLSDIK